MEPKRKDSGVGRLLVAIERIGALGSRIRGIVFLGAIAATSVLAAFSAARKVLLEVDHKVGEVRVRRFRQLV